MKAIRYLQETTDEHKEWEHIDIKKSDLIKLCTIESIGNAISKWNYTVDLLYIVQYEELKGLSIKNKMTIHIDKLQRVHPLMAPVGILIELIAPKF